MHTDLKRLVEPWNNTPFNSSSAETLQHRSSKSSAVMYSPSKRYPDNDHSYTTVWSCHTKDFPVEYSPDSVTSRVDQRFGSLRNEQRPLLTSQDSTTPHNDSFRNLDSIFCTGQRKEYYYDTSIREPGMYKYQHSTASIYSQVDENIRVHCNKSSDRSTLRTMYDIPGVVDSETSSFGNSFDYSDSADSHHSQSQPQPYNTTSNKTSNTNSHEYQYKGYEHRNGNRHHEKHCTPEKMKVGAVMSHGSFQKKHVSGAPKCKMIEVAPGEFMRLRGAQETWKAIQDDFYLPCACICCELTLFCIQDATYVLCPECQVVNCLEKIDGYDGGVGLGFTMEELAEWQNDIVMNRRF